MSAGNSAYSPLPQSNSDSDGSSEEEFQVFRGNVTVNRAAKIQNSTAEKGHNEPKNISYKPLGGNSAVGISLNKFQSRRDEVSIRKPNVRLDVFSTSRKIWFALSLLLCIFVTFAFIWLLPCDLNTCLSVSSLRGYNFSWEENLSNLDVHGPISLVPDVEGNQNLIFFTSYSDPKQNYSEHGLMCLKGIDGLLRWKLKLDGEPNDIDCNLTDINTDGIGDCIVLGRNVLTVVNPISGKVLWDFWKSNKNVGRAYFNGFPLIVTDLDGDEIKELILSCSFATSEVGVTFENYLVILSGKTGQIINHPLQIKTCSTVKDLVLEGVTVVSFTCSNSDGRESFEKINIAKLYRSLKSVVEGKATFHKWEKPKQHIKFPSEVRIYDFILNLENKGNCPDNCFVSVVVRDVRANSDRKLVQLVRKNTFGMTPVVLKTSKEIGFLVKLWKWHPETEKPDFQNDPTFVTQKTVIAKDKTRRLMKRSKKFNYSLSNSEILDNEMLSERARETQRAKRTAARHRLVRSEDASNSRAFRFTVITEIIVKIALNKPRSFFEYVSKEEIIQICRKPGICQPDVNKHSHSVFLANFGKYREMLISFSTKYVQDNKNSDKNSEDWFLKSRIRALNL